jgi:hypothetical protein
MRRLLISYVISISPVLFNIYIHKVIKEWQHMIKQNVMIKNLILNTILFADDQVIVTIHKMIC